MALTSARFGSAGDPPIAITIELDGFDGLALQRDPSAAEWIAAYLWQGPRLASGHFTVRSLAAPGFESYARIEYPPASRTPDVLAKLLDALIPHTTTPDDAVFCLWEGYGGLEPRPAGVSLLEGWSRRYYVYRGPVSAAVEFTAWPLGVNPEVVCPADRAWVLGTDTDFSWYFLGGAETAVSAVERTEGLDVRRVGPDDAVAP